MQFELQGITLCGDRGKTDIFAMVAVGVGLAYHEDFDGDEEEYSITHIASGHCILRSESKGVIVGSLPSAEAAERFIERIASFADWNLPEEILRKLNHEKVFQTLRDAYREAVGEEHAI